MDVGNQPQGPSSMTSDTCCRVLRWGWGRQAAGVGRKILLTNPNKGIRFADMGTVSVNQVVVPLAEQLDGWKLARHRMDRARVHAHETLKRNTEKRERLMDQLVALEDGRQKCDDMLLLYAADYVFDGIIPGETTLDRIPSKERLCLVCHISRGTLDRWAKDPKTPLELLFQGLIERLEAKQATVCLNLHPDPRCEDAAGGPNERVAMRVLTKHGYIEQTASQAQATAVVVNRVGIGDDPVDSRWNADGSRKQQLDSIDATQLPDAL